METELARHCISISIITVVYAHAVQPAAVCSQLQCSGQPGLQPLLHIAAAAETTAASVAFTAPAVASAVAVASVATTAAVTFAVATV